MSIIPLNAKTFFFIKSDRITTRGCLSPGKQRKFNDDSCSICQTSNCNSHIFPEHRSSPNIENIDLICSSNEDDAQCIMINVNKRNSCIKCDSDIDEKCRTKPKELIGTICPQFRSPHRNGCYLSIVS